MLCLKSEALELDNDHDLYALVVAPININFGSMIYRYLRRRKKTTCNSSTSRLSSDASDALNSCNKTQDGESDDETPRNICRYKFQLQQDVNQLKRELQEEIGVHLALADAIHQSATSPSSISLSSLPPKVLDLLSNVAMLEITVSKLEKELASLHFQLTQERNERCLAQYRLQHFSPSPPPPPPPPPIWLSRSYIEDKDGEMDIVGLLQGTLKDDSDDKHSYIETLGNHPNWLSEEMVRCMRNIFLCLAHSSNPFYDSPHPHISHSFVATLSGSSVMDEFTESTHDMRYDTQVSEKEKMVDPYQVQGKVINSMRDIGSYSKVAEVSWMSVGEKQLEYAATALKRFRLLVEQLAKVNPACMSHSERLAFWINLYNALMMHAYLAYGVPRSDMNFFSFMQKAAYTVGGHSFNALDIEYVILKIRPPTHRPQMALLLALHKFKMPEDQRKYSIEMPEPLVEFALSCGMRSSPAIRIFKAANVADDLKDSLRDYIRASVGLSNKGKLLVPKLLHSYAKGIVEDASLPEWICQYICPEQAAVVRDNLSRRKQRLLRTRSFAVLPFDSQFRYLFLPDLNQDRQVQIEAKFLLVDPSKKVIPHPLKHQRVHGGLNLQICNSK
ncbi:hypothetical protein Sjap_012062 [Stephania japonica]|uniref:DUF547 domain-containing protein n=1 Tax=Stephania japonica TaxID=461633 RepID=A0AAP0P7Y8_9MAGN